MLSVRTYVRTSKLFKSRKTKQQKTMFATGLVMGLAEWIIDDTFLVKTYFWNSVYKISAVIKRNMRLTYDNPVVAEYILLVKTTVLTWQDILYRSGYIYYYMRWDDMFRGLAIKITIYILVHKTRNKVVHYYFFGTFGIVRTSNRVL